MVNNLNIITGKNQPKAFDGVNNRKGATPKPSIAIIPSFTPVKMVILLVFNNSLRLTDNKRMPNIIKAMATIWFADRVSLKNITLSIMVIKAQELPIGLTRETCPSFNPL